MSALSKHTWMADNKVWLLSQTPEARKRGGSKITLINTWKRAHPGGNYRDHLDEVYGYEFPLCKCGCGEKVSVIGNLFLHGHNRPWQGKKRGETPKTVKEKQRLSHLGRKYVMTEAGHIVLSEKGKVKHTPERIEKVRKSLTGKKLTKEHIKNTMRRRSITSLELRFQNIIDENKLPYRFVGNGDFIIDGLNPDFININGEKIAIEVYARFYKELKGRSVEKYKADRISRLSPFGWKIYFFDEKQVKSEFVLKTLGGDSH
jgi:hypothetical protein